MRSMLGIALASASFCLPSTIAVAQPREVANTRNTPATPAQPVKEIVLASTEKPVTPKPGSPTTGSDSGKRAMPRITTCRCGDPSPDREVEQQR